VKTVIVGNVYDISVWLIAVSNDCRVLLSLFGVYLRFISVSTVTLPEQIQGPGGSL